MVGLTLTRKPKSKRPICINLLRNCLWKRLFLNEFKAHGGGGFLECVQLSVGEFFLVSLQTLADVGFAMFDQPVNDPRQFMGRGGDAFRRAESGFHAAGEAAPSPVRS